MSINSQQTSIEYTPEFDGDDEDQNLSGRASKLTFNQTFSFVGVDFKELTFAVPYNDNVYRSATSFYVRINLKRGYVLYSCNFKDNANQSIKEINTGFWQSAYTIIEKPRQLKWNGDNSFSILKTSNGWEIKIKGWKCYLIKESFLPISLDLLLSIPLDGFMISKEKSYVSKFIDPSSIIKDCKVDGNYFDKWKIDVEIINSIQKFSSKILTNIALSLGSFNNIEDLDIREKEVDKSISLDDVKPTDIVEDVRDVVRIYHTTSMSSVSCKRFSLLGRVSSVSHSNIRTIFQIWYGDSKNMLELLIDNSEKHKSNDVFRIFYTKDGKGKYQSNLDRVLTDVPLSDGYKVYEIVLDFKNNDVIDVTAQRKFLYSLRLPIQTKFIRCGFEIQILDLNTKLFNTSNLKRIVGFGNIEKIIIDGSVANFTIDNIPLSNLNVGAKDIKSKVEVALSNVKEVKDLFLPLPLPAESTPTEVVPVEPSRNNNEVKTDGDDIGGFKLNKNFISIRSSVLGKDTEDRLFNQMVEYYVRLGFPEDQAEFIIYQFAVSFCTSKNSTTDRKNFIHWRNKDGAIRILSKGKHSRLFQSLTNFPCNVERTVLAGRSDKILKLLRDRQLLWPYKNAEKRGIKPEFAYMACDFLKVDKAVLSEEEQLAITSQRMYVNLSNKHKRSIVSVNQIA
ncbi:p77 [Diodia vein chlorosis virus]|uniref:p77 n=1 Tax=Diodia vein chlorosis virus TaxID=656520 RepID=E7BKK3_9CLOS|nr:p77 [Diodia vein chlorosis virus]ADU25039.1 p77 [Diodia vein chlorosis virus]